MAYVRPVPGGRIGRTDQGVDISAPPGTPVRAIADETLMGIVQNWYKGQPFYWFRDAFGRYNYVAEQFRSGLRVGQSVRAGQVIGTVAPSGTGLELGFAQSEAAAASGHPTPGYREGQATVLGQQYRQQVIQGGSGSGTISLEKLWLDAGGPPGVAQTMAAIALAESGGQVGSVNKSSGAAGLWQILPSAHPQYDVHRLTTDPLYNAQAAVAIYKSEGLGAWTTYTSGAFRQFLGRANSATVNYGGPNGGMVRPGGDTGSGDPLGVLKNYQDLRSTPRTAPPGTKNPILWFWSSFTDNWDKM